jgi:hypothetical protein
MFVYNSDDSLESIVPLASEQRMRVEQYGMIGAFQKELGNTRGLNSFSSLATILQVGG